MPMNDDLLTQKEVANALGVHVNTLAEWRRRGIGPEWKRIGPRLIRYSLVAVEEFLATHPDEVKSK